jgi:hypothetical protein
MAHPNGELDDTCTLLVGAAVEAFDSSTGRAEQN